MPNNYYDFNSDFVPGQKVRSDDMNVELNGIEGGFDLLPTDSTALLRGTNYLGVESGSGNSYVVTLTDARTSYQEGDKIAFRATHVNTAAASINLDGLGLIALVRADDNPTQSGDFVVGAFYEAVYHLTENHFQLLTPSASTILDADNRVLWAAEWANKAIDSLISTDAGGNGTSDYSALHWGDGASQAWAINAEDSAIGTTFGGDGVATFSSLHWAAKSATSAGASLASEAAAAISEGNATLETGYSAEWATKPIDSLISIAAGGNGSSDYSSLHWGLGGAKSWAIEAENTPVPTTFGGDGVSEFSARHWSAKAQTFAAGVNLPSVQAGDVAKILEVNAGETGYDLVARAATDIKTGLVELATAGEVTTGTDAVRAITPLTLQSQRNATDALTGTVELATPAEVVTGTDTTRAVTAAGIQGKVATDALKGIVELATPAEVVTGTDSTRAVTAAGVHNKTASETERGVIEIATAAEVAAVTSNTLAVTPLGLLSQPAGSTGSKGIVELATNGEVVTGSSTTLVVTANGLHNKIASTTARGIAELATNAEVVTGASTTLVVTANGLHNKIASTTARGLSELSTVTEARDGTSTTRVITPDALEGYIGQVVADHSNADQTRNNTSLGNTDLVCTLNKTGKYIVELYLPCSMSAATGTGFSYYISTVSGTTPTNGSTMWCIRSANVDQIEQITRDTGTPATKTLSPASPTSNQFVTMRGSYSVTGTPPQMRLQYARVGTSSTLTLQAGAFMRWERISGLG